MSTPRTRRTRLALAAALGAAAVIGAAAGSAATGATRAFSAKPGEKLAYSVTRLSAPAGRVTLRMTNRDDIAVRGKKLASPKKGRIVGTGRVSTVTATLPPGTYTFYCSVFGHEESGMRGTLRVVR